MCLSGLYSSLLNFVIMDKNQAAYRIQPIMHKWLAVPHLNNPYETFAARVLHYTLLLLLITTMTFVFFASSPAQLVFIPGVLAVFVFCYGLLHTGHLRLASLIFLSGLWLVITMASFSINGVRNAGISSYAIVIIFSAVLFANRAVMVFTGLSVLAVVILAAGETWGMLPLRTTPLYLADRLFQQIALFGAAGILLFAASRVIRTSFGRVREHEIILMERNRALETEIAERQRTEASLRVSEARYRLLFENIPIMASVYGQDGEIILMNKAAAKTLGGTPETLQGRNMRDLLAPEDAEYAIRIHEQVMAKGNGTISEGEVKLPTEREMYYLRHVMPLPDLGGNNTSQVLVLTTDLTEKREAEQRKRELATAHERNSFLTEFFGTVSHDLKTPLTIMTTSLYLLERAQTAEQSREKAMHIREQIILMDKYIQDMLTISRLEHLPLYDFQALDLNRLVEGVVDLLHPQMESKQLACQLDEQPNLPPVRGDQEQLHRLLLNLIENAVNYTPDGGQICIRTYVADRRISLEVIDSGIGIEPDAMPHIFERFFRTSNARMSQSKGTGLGLAIVKKIAEMHTASIEVSSQPDTGTTFCIRFPAETS